MWTPTEDETLVTMISSGSSAAEIAEVLSRPKDAVWGRARRLKMNKGRPGDEYDEMKDMRRLKCINRIFLKLLAAEAGVKQRPITSSNKRSCNYIIDLVVDRVGVDRSDIMSFCREGRVSYSRHLAMYLCRVLLGKTYAEIGRVFGYDYTSVYGAYDKIKSLAGTDKRTMGDIEAITQCMHDLESEAA